MNPPKQSPSIYLPLFYVEIPSLPNIKKQREEEVWKKEKQRMLYNINNLNKRISGKRYTIVKVFEDLAQLIGGKFLDKRLGNYLNKAICKRIFKLKGHKVMSREYVFRFKRTD